MSVAKWLVVVVTRDISWQHVFLLVSPNYIKVKENNARLVITII